MEIELSGLIDALPGLVWTTTPDGSVDFINQRWREYAGLTIDEVRADGWKSAIHPDDMPLAQAKWDSLFAAGEAGEVEVRLRRFDGEYRRFSIKTSPLTDESGRIVGWCGINTEIEDLLRAEEEAREHRQRYQQIVDGLPGIVALFTPEGRITFCNRQMLEYLDQTLEGVQAKASAYNFHPDDRDAVLAEWAACVGSGRPFFAEARLERADGVFRWHRTRVYPLRDAAGRIEVWYGLSIDIEETKQAEAELAAEKIELRQAYQQLTEAQRLSQTGSFTVDIAADHHIWSQELYPIFEFEPGSAISFERVRAAIHPDDLAQFDGGLARAAAGRAGFDGYFRIITPGGRQKYLHCVAHLISQEGDTPVFVGALQDVTAARLAEEALKASEAELKRANRYLTGAQRLSRTGSFTWDPERDEHNWSEENLRIWEFDAETRIGTAVLAAIHPEDLPHFEAVHTRALQTGGDYELFYRIVTRSGAVKHVHTVGERQPDVTDRFLFIGATQDVTESRLAEDALTRARAELAHVARAATLSALTASIAHEVNQPLAGIITNASTCLRMLAADPPNLDGARATAQRTIRDGNRASEVIHRLRGMFARKQATTEAVDLNEAAREVLALSASELQSARVVQRFDFAADLPAVLGDRVQLQQVILNLILNAADAMRAVDDRPRNLWLATARDDPGGVTLSVRDEGVGIDAQSVERLFDPFYTTKSEGMGIGLAVSRSIIQSHDGRLWATPNGDRPGATFAFSIPLERPSPVA
jgi:PAS domain S-box-containing protein